MILDELYNTILSRKEKLPLGSYVSSLFKNGKDRIIQKVGEEVVEVVIAAKNKNRERLISEIADLVFHILVLLAACNVSFDEILTELKKRQEKKT